MAIVAWNPRLEGEEAFLLHLGRGVGESVRARLAACARSRGQPLASSSFVSSPWLHSPAFQSTALRYHD